MARRADRAHPRRDSRRVHVCVCVHFRVAVAVPVGQCRCRVAGAGPGPGADPTPTRAGHDDEDELVETTTELHAREIKFAAMGSDVHVVVLGGRPDLCRFVRDRIAELEARWSRFRPDSELSRLNAMPGRPVVVSEDTRIAISAAVDAWRITEGRFDPSILAALVAVGYDRDFASLDRGRTGAVVPAGPSPGCAGIEIDPIVRSISLPEGTTVDLGGIGKGLAADLVIADLRDAGALGGCVNIGGDLRAFGQGPTSAGWIVDLGHLPGVLIGISEGGIATSSTLKRRWVRDGVEQHHLLDPRRGLPVDSGIAAVTVIAGTAATGRGPDQGRVRQWHRRRPEDHPGRRRDRDPGHHDRCRRRARRPGGLPPMSAQLWWYTARAGGLVAWGLATASVVWGLMLSGRITRKPKPAWVLDLHRFLGALTVVFVGIHVFALWADSFVHFGPAELFVPLASSWKPGAVAWGIVAMYLLVAIEATSLLQRRIPRRAWHAVHLSSFALFGFATIHALTAGTDSGTVAVIGFAIGSVALVANLTVLRVVSRRAGQAPRPGRDAATTRSAAAHR